MKQVEKIWAELSAKEVAQESTELSEEVKVELALMDDLDRLSGDVKEITFDHRSAIMQFEEAAQKLKARVKGNVNQSVDLLTAINNAEKMASDLGVDVNLSKYQTILDNYYKVTQDLDELLRKV
jgi:spore coat polysaccharide biosynthesis predicted glycosyltransferase SpsG